MFSRNICAVGMGPIVESSCDADVGLVMTAGVGAEVGTDADAATGSDSEVGVANPLHPTSAKIVRVPSKSEVTGPEPLFSPVDFPRFEDRRPSLTSFTSSPQRGKHLFGEELPRGGLRGADEVDVVQPESHQQT